MNNIKALTDFQRTLVEDNLGLISYAMNKLPIYLFDSREDAFQIGTIGLMKAARSFDPSRNILFSTYAIPCIVNELRMALRHINSSNPPGRTCSYDAPLLNADSDTLSLLDMIPSDDQPVEERITVHETLSEVIATLKHLKDPDAFEIIRISRHHAVGGQPQDREDSLCACTGSSVLILNTYGHITFAGEGSLPLRRFSSHFNFFDLAGMLLFLIVVDPHQQKITLVICQRFYIFLPLDLINRSLC